MRHRYQADDKQMTRREEDEAEGEAEDVDVERERKVGERMSFDARQRYKNDTPEPYRQRSYYEPSCSSLLPTLSTV